MATLAMANEADRDGVDTQSASPSTSALLSQMEATGQGDRGDGGDAQAAFLNRCSQCHDTERATSKLKTREEWLATVRRMSEKTGSNILKSEIEPITDYLASLNAAEPAPDDADRTPPVKTVLAESSVTVNGTVSLLWRKGDMQVENEGFSPDVWVGADWRPKDSPFRAQVMACTTCHDNGSGGLNAELVEGSFTADLIHMMTGRSADERDSDVELEAKAGRFIVPFGAFSGLAHPGVYRTISNPLMYNMGRRVGYYEPVLPMPYADEGVDLHLGVPVPAGFAVQLDGYAINGLQEGGFTPSRSWHDNNSNTALGGRVTLGSSWIVLGGSFATGELQASGNPTTNYQLEGGDVTLRYRDYIRGYFEYARRVEDTTPTLESTFSGHVVEVEGLLWRNPKISMLVRYDNIMNPVLYGGATIERFTWGPNITLPGGSLLIINHEHWMHDDPLQNEDIVGGRWVVSF